MSNPLLLDPVISPELALRHPFRGLGVPEDLAKIGTLLPVQLYFFLLSFVTLHLVWRARAYAYITASSCKATDNTLPCTLNTYLASRNASANEKT